MTLLAGFLDVLLRGLGLVAFSIAVGGVAFLLLLGAGRTGPSALDARARARSLRLIAGAALTLAVTTTMALGLKPWALASPDGRWPVLAFLGTEYAVGGVLRVAAAALLAGLAARLARRPRARHEVLILALPTVALIGASAWASHALARLDDRLLLMILDMFHRTAAALWVGGLVHLLAFWLEWKREGADGLGLAVLRRFSRMAVRAVLVLLVAGLSQTVLYVGSIGGLVGTGYGIMVVSKVVLLAVALLLGGWNNVLVRRLGAGAGELPPSRLRWLVEAEIAVVVAVLLAAASLTSLPPAIDVREDRATLSEVAARFQPRIPRLASPPITELLATAAPISAVSAPRQPAEYAWSEYNHHMAGLFVLAMGLVASFERDRRRSWARHWPLLLLGLAAFMFVRNDPRAWPLGPAGFWETLLLPDVLQHRISVALVVALGAVEWLVRAGRLRSARWAYVFPLLCLAGGALLLTHSHAMFNLKAEFLTEVTHTPLGVLGVVLGCSRWLQLRLPPPDNRLPGRVWAAAMVVMGLILTFYREG